MAELTGKFQLTVGDEDNFDKIMAAAGNVWISLVILVEMIFKCSHLE